MSFSVNMQLDYESDPPVDDAKSLEKELTLNVVVSQLATDFDRESNLCLERFSRTRHASVISTGSLKLDLALGIGGLPKVLLFRLGKHPEEPKNDILSSASLIQGRMVEIFGKEASGKTTLALHIVKEAQKNGGYCAYIDAENAFNPSFAEAIDVDTEKLLIAQPDSTKNSLSIVNTLVSGSIDVVVVDSTERIDLSLKKMFQIYLVGVVSRGTPALQTIQMAFLGLKRWLSIYTKSSLFSAGKQGPVVQFLLPCGV